MLIEHTGISLEADMKKYSNSMSWIHLCFLQKIGLQETAYILYGSKFTTARNTS